MQPRPMFCLVLNPVGACLGVDSRVTECKMRREANARKIVAHVSNNSRKAQTYIDQLVAGRSLRLKSGTLVQALPSEWDDTGVVKVRFANGISYVCRNLEVFKRVCLAAKKSERSLRLYECHAIDDMSWLEDEFSAKSLFVTEPSNDYCLRMRMEHMTISMQFKHHGRINLCMRAKFPIKEVYYMRDFKQKEDVLAAVTTVADAMMIMGKWRLEDMSEFRNKWTAFVSNGSCFTEAEVLAFMLSEQYIAPPYRHISAWCRHKTPSPVDRRSGAIRATVLMNEECVFHALFGDKRYGFH